MRTNDRKVGVCAKPSDKGKQEMPDWEESINVTFTEHIDSDTVSQNIRFSLWAKILESDLMMSSEEESFHMLHFSVAEKEPILTEQGLRFGCINSYHNIANISIWSCVIVSEGYFLKA